MKPLWMPLLVCVSALFLIAVTGADHAMSDAFFDPATRRFPLRFDFWTERVMHRGVRDGLIGLGIAAIALACFGRRTGRPSTREVARMVVLSLIVGTTTIGGLKIVVNRYCPWTYTRYGGHVVEGSEEQLFRIGWHDSAFPAGHAAGGYALLVLWFAGRRRSPAAARAGLITGLAAGTLMGLSQVARGAHFLSHNVWTAGICWYIAWGVDRLVPHD